MPDRLSPTMVPVIPSSWPTFSAEDVAELGLALCLAAWKRAVRDA